MNKPIPPMPPLLNQTEPMNLRSRTKNSTIQKKTIIQNDDDSSFSLSSNLELNTCDSTSGRDIPFHVNVANTSCNSFGTQNSTQVSILDENQRLKAVNESLQRQNDCYMQMQGHQSFCVRSARSKMKQDKALSNSIKMSMQQKIIPYYKWIPKEEMNNLSDSSIAADIMTDLGIKKTQWAEFWAEYSSVAWLHSNTERSKMNRYMKDAFEKGKDYLCRILFLCHYSRLLFLAFVAIKTDSLLDHEKKFFENIMKSDKFDFGCVYDSKQNYAAFLSLFGWTTVRSSKFRNVDIYNFEDNYTTSDEAYCLAYMEGSFANFKATNLAKFAKNPNHPNEIYHTTLTKEEKLLFPSLEYTKNENGITGNLNSGWTKEGLDSYDSYEDKSIEFRKGENFKVWLAFAIDNNPKITRNKAKPSRVKRVRTETEREQIILREQQTQQSMRLRFEKNKKRRACN